MKKYIAVMSFAFLSACGGGVDSPALPQVQSPVVWEVQKDIQGTQGNYLSVLINDATNIVVYSNSNGSDNTADAKLYESSGNFELIQNTKTAFDLKGYYLRTFGIDKGLSTNWCYGVFRLEGNGPKNYGDGSYYPHFGYSIDCKNWIVSDNKMWLGNSNSNTLLVDESKLALDDLNPVNNLFVVYDDSLGAKLSLSYSKDGITWSHYSKDNKVVELWPSSLSTANPQFGSVAKTPFGYHAIFANWSNAVGSATSHIHLFSCDGLQWTVLDTNAPTMNSTKGTTLAYEKATGNLHAFSAGKHLLTKARAYPCK